MYHQCTYREWRCKTASPKCCVLAEKITYTENVFMRSREHSAYVSGSPAIRETADSASPRYRSYGDQCQALLHPTRRRLPGFIVSKEDTCEV